MPVTATEWVGVVAFLTALILGVAAMVLTIREQTHEDSCARSCLPHVYRRVQGACECMTDDGHWVPEGDVADGVY